MFRRLFILTAGLSFALFLLLSLAIAWGTVAMTGRVFTAATFRVVVN